MEDKEDKPVVLSQRDPYKPEDRKGKVVIKGPKAIERIKWKSEQKRKELWELN